MPPSASLPPAFLVASTDGRTPGEAAELATAETDEFDLAAAIAAMPEADVFAGLSQP